MPWKPAFLAYGCTVLLIALAVQVMLLLGDCPICRSITTLALTVPVFAAGGAVVAPVQDILERRFGRAG